MASIYGVTADAQLAVKARSAERPRGAGAGGSTRCCSASTPAWRRCRTPRSRSATTDAINQQFAFFNAIVAIAVLVGMLGIVNTLSMSVLERTREIGVLRAVGGVALARAPHDGRREPADLARRHDAGMAAGMLVALVWIVGMRESTFPGLALRLPIGTLSTIAVLGVVIGVVAAVLPARRAARLDPLTALRYE